MVRCLSKAIIANEKVFCLSQSQLLCSICPLENAKRTQLDHTIKSYRVIPYHLNQFIEPTCAICKVGSYASLSVCLSVRLSVCVPSPVVHVTCADCKVGSLPMSSCIFESLCAERPRFASVGHILLINLQKDGI